ncbi:hypothetical protein A3736_07445 [Erythrobacter sp. HI0063]|jgi:hypothetical protein|uniref:DUF1206 domain-containing protein n=1 Tax=Erythrobacter sp. HI0063 TaxID=1822240 RepID=UPI0007C3EE35|nr:DUF1206 domain-containing protein [Erythrobacter sp. HI0063]KZY56640.1 hypothetical protein A3736_07445 [Erythrobacter sp. HI0063]|tara:strand:- start:1367 stop:2185 length:819 start_codon:yes stop_codon:yes gene_type:complete
MVDKSEKFSWLVRVGYFSRAILYSVLGLIALTSADRIAEGTNGIFLAIEDYPAGNAILWLMVVGLTAYALFRFASTFFDIENNGSDAKGWGKRLGHAGSGIGHLALAFSAYKFASDNSTGGSGGGQSGGGAQEAASGILSMEFGGIVLGLLGLAFFVTAIFQAKKGITGEFMHRIAGDAPDATRWIGGAGYLARGVVYAVIGWSLFKAGFLSAGSGQVKTLGDAVASLAGQGIVFTLVAVGLLLFGLFSLVLSRYRIIPELDSSKGIPKFRV